MIIFNFIDQFLTDTTLSDQPSRTVSFKVAIPVRLRTTLLSLSPILGVAILSISVASHRVESKVCTSNPVMIKLAAQQAIKNRLSKLHFPIFSYSNDDGTYVSNNLCDWTVLGRVEAQADDGAMVRLGWAVNLGVKPGDPVAEPIVASSVVF